MNCCNSSLNKNKQDFVCPHCSHRGHSVEIITLQSLLRVRSLKKIKEESNYKYCKTSTCDISYFSEDHYFQVNDLKVKATDKDQGLNVLVCYCFGQTRESILNGFKSTNDFDVIEDIKKKMNDPGCFCERSNPQGSCCLGNVSAWIKQLKIN